MKLVWHIAQKDLRRLAIPLAVWLVLILLPTVLFALATPRIEGHAGSVIDMTVGGMTIWIRLVIAIQIIIGFVLAGTLVLEDPVVGTNCFWLTRPIANGRLLAAKLLAAALGFLVLPSLALTPLWIANGFGIGDIWNASCAFGAVQGIAVAVAVVMASLSRSLAQFLFYTILVLGLLFAVVTLSQSFTIGLTESVRASRNALFLGVVIISLLAVLVQQFGMRETRRSWLVLAGAFFVLCAITTGWRWDILGGRIAKPFASVERAEDRVVQIVADPTLTRHTPRSLPSLYVSAPWSGGQQYAPVLARLEDGRVARASGAGSNEAGLRALGLKSGEEPVRWQFNIFPLGRQVVDDRNVAGAIEVWSVRTRILGEMPVRVGAEIVHGANRSRIVSLEQDGDRLDSIFVEERDAAAAAASELRLGGAFNRTQSDDGSPTYFDHYFLVNRAERKAVLAGGSDLGLLSMTSINSLFLRYCRLSVHLVGDRSETVVVKLRFERDQRFERRFETHGVIDRSAVRKKAK